MEMASREGFTSARLVTVEEPERKDQHGLRGGRSGPCRESRRARPPVVEGREGAGVRAVCCILRGTWKADHHGEWGVLPHLPGRRRN